MSAYIAAVVLILGIFLLIMSKQGIIWTKVVQSVECRQWISMVQYIAYREVGSFINLAISLSLNFYLCNPICISLPCRTAV
ncbi:hypothetical protein XELAEV_18026760mg [Xenopus laevis]|uniref:Uncharacterized protein n=1 Tax=Xenopus laevis TaxID=8355 RepID=A0A974CUB2_XENLA|nr:hypothetical protein XELAEV_18026760mg [Xenopus laevis]